MPNTKTREILIGAVFGIVGAVVGSVVNGLMTANLQDKQQRTNAMLESFKAEEGNFPVEYLQLKQFIDEMRTLSIASSNTISRLAAIHKKFPGCAKNLTEACRPALVETIQAMRDELDSGSVSSEDLDLLIKSKYETASQAIQELNK